MLFFLFILFQWRKELIRDIILYSDLLIYNNAFKLFQVKNYLKGEENGLYQQKY